MEPATHLELRLAVCQAEVYEDDPPPGADVHARRMGSKVDALAELLHVLQTLLDLETVDDLGMLERWNRRHGYPLAFRSPSPAECA